tara:strand:+ start:502 stop:843 length:342 start_codon:yes stop_codon:yes gene_type:complete
MKLTGKCKEDFKNYLLNDITDFSYKYNYFINLQDSMQYGVYVDFFDSVGINIDVCHNYILDGKNDNIIVLGYYYELNAQPNIHVSQYCEDHKTRPESRTQAIEKVNEIYNSKK